MKMGRPASLFVIMMLLTMTILPGTPGPTVQAAPTKPRIPEWRQTVIQPATLRTMNEMLADEAAQVRPRASGGAIPFRPGMDPTAYAAAKKAAAAMPRAPKPSVPATPRAAQAAAILNCDGEDETLAGGSYPPDADGAFGYSPTARTLEFVQTTNQHVTGWDAAHAFFVGCSTARLFDVSLSSFFGYLNAPLFDPRVVHDDTYKRWVISAEAFAEASGAQYQFIAVSISDNANGPYFIFSFNTTILTCSTCFWDFPQLGMDDQALILTANAFNPDGSFAGSVMFFLNKQHMYYGLQLIGCFTPLGGAYSPFPSWAPPKVLDLSPLTWMVEAPPSGSFLQVVAVEATGQICPTLVNYPTVSTVSVPSYTVPPSAPQPGTVQLLDTSDSRFENRSTQVGGVLWQVHTIALAGAFAAPRLYRIGLSIPPTVQFAYVVTSGTSQDFNASIVANPANTIAVSWSSTDPPAGINAQVRVELCSGATTACAGAGILVSQSTNPLVGNVDPSGLNTQRWGDYSFAAIDGSGSFAGGVNEEVNNPHDATGNTWGTRFFVSQFP